LRQEENVGDDAHAIRWSVCIVPKTLYILSCLYIRVELTIYPPHTRDFFCKQSLFRGISRLCDKLDPGLKMQNTFAFATANFFYLTIQRNCSACNIPSDEGLLKRTNFSTQIVGLAGIESPTRATCVTGSVNNSSAIH
jgi:hypothetical protein